MESASVPCRSTDLRFSLKRTPYSTLATSISTDRLLPMAQPMPFELSSKSQHEQMQTNGAVRFFSSPCSTLGDIPLAVAKFLHGCITIHLSTINADGRSFEEGVKLMIYADKRSTDAASHTGVRDTWCSYGVDGREFGLRRPLLTERRCDSRALCNPAGDPVAWWRPGLEFRSADRDLENSIDSGYSLKMHCRAVNIYFQYCLPPRPLRSCTVGNRWAVAYGGSEVGDRL